MISWTLAMVPCMQEFELSPHSLECQGIPLFLPPLPLPNWLQTALSSCVSFWMKTGRLQTKTGSLGKWHWESRIQQHWKLKAATVTLRIFPTSLLGNVCFLLCSKCWNKKRWGFNTAWMQFTLMPNSTLESLYQVIFAASVTECIIPVYFLKWCNFSAQ